MRNVTNRVLARIVPIKGLSADYMCWFFVPKVVGI